MREVSIPATVYILNEPSEKFYRESRERSFGMKLEDILPAGTPKYEEVWKGLGDGLDKLASLYDKNEPGALFYFGKQFTFADLLLISYFVYLKNVVGEETREWKSVEQVGSGRWKRLLEENKHLYRTL